MSVVQITANGLSQADIWKREVLEETGLEVNVNRLIGIYTSLNLLLEYPDENKWQLVVLHFDAELASGELKPSEETTELGFFSISEINDLDMNGLDRKRTLDGFVKSYNAFINDDFSM